MTTSKFIPPADWIVRPSPNYNKRSHKVDSIILHADAASRIDSSLGWVRRKESKVSYHIMIGRKGEVYLVVNPDDRAWHAGVSTFNGKNNVNNFSIGVCLSNKNDGVEKHTEVQLAAAAKVCALLCKHYGILLSNITTHAVIAPGRKTDPVALDLETFKKLVQAED